MDDRARLTGVFPPCVTPFAEDQTVDHAALAENIRLYNETRIRGYMPLGTNGEFRSLTDGESIRIVETYARSRRPEKTIIAGVGRESTRSTIEMARAVASAGADYASVLPPHYFAGWMNDDVLNRHFTDVADASPIPILLYNIPRYTGGVSLSPDLIRALAGHPRIVGLKDSSSENIEIYTQAVPSGANFWVLAGTINKFFSGLQAGGIGGVLSLADYLPGECCRLQELHTNGAVDESARLDVRLRALSARAAGSHGVAGVKAAMDLLGFRGGSPRLPLPALDETAIRELRTTLAEAGFTAADASPS